MAEASPTAVPEQKPAPATPQPLTDSKRTVEPDGSPPPVMSESQRRFVSIYSLLSLVIPTVYTLHYLQGHTLQGQETIGPVLILCCLLGMGMGAVHSLASIAGHAGNRRLGAAWIFFYIYRPFTGAGMALATVLVLSSGLGGFKVDWQQDPLILLAWAALAGLYSQPALNKLKELFQSLFQTRQNGDGGS